ncbi:ribonucleotide reductase [Babesia gibsoni]|uniref:Ribonucleotide reductase n=1 Tax=Babesia gibsoni TaxID=33632 RepID=A0AAD8LFV5_BABGI|nr:ribonucleotide reductase [Babesia gibsoni]
MEAVPVKYLSPEEVGKEQEKELLLKENPNRWVMFPIEYHVFWELYKEIENNFWASENYRFSDDREAATKLDKAVYDCMVKLVYYHAQLDLKDLAKPTAVTLAMLSEVQIPEMRAFYGFQVSYENIHSEVFGSIGLTLPGSCDTDVGKDKRNWLASKFGGAKCYYEKVVIQCISKLVFRSCFAIFSTYLDKENLLPTIVKAMKMVEKDIGIHLRFASSTLDHLKLRLAKEHVAALLQEALELELAFCKEVLPLAVMGLTEDQLKEYIKSSVNQCFLIAGHPEEHRLDDDVEWLGRQMLDLKVTVKTAQKMKSVPSPLPEPTMGPISFDDDF